MQGETAERILKAADALMVDRGYSAFSYADISEAVDIRKASIHHHFPTKADLATAVLRARHERLVEGTKQLEQRMENPLARIEAYIRHWERCIRDRSMEFCVAVLMGAELPSLPEPLQKEVRLYFRALGEWFKETLEEGVRQGVVTLHGSAETEAQTLMAVVHGAMLSARTSGNCEVFKSVTDAALTRISAQRTARAKPV